MFAWGVAEELVPANVAHGLREVRGLLTKDLQLLRLSRKPLPFVILRPDAFAE